MAVTPSDRMGLGQGGIKVSKPTELRSALPNQLSRGDHVDAAFTVMNRAKDTRALKVSIEASGAARGKIVQSLTLKPFERRNVSSEEHMSELQSLMRISHAVFCL